jgi:hypothetical protein
VYIIYNSPSKKIKKSEPSYLLSPSARGFCYSLFVDKPEKRKGPTDDPSPFLLHPVFEQPCFNVLPWISPLLPVSLSP